MTIDRGPVEGTSVPADAAHHAHDHEAISAVFSALAEPARLQIVHALDLGEARVVDLTGVLGLAQSTVSAHVAVLRQAGLLLARHEGRSTYYSLATPALVSLVAHAEELLAEGLSAVVHDHSRASGVS